MKIADFVKHFMPTQLRPVGRWRIETCHKQMNQKIDWSNEDHCGPCGQYGLEKYKKSKNGEAKF